MQGKQGNLGVVEDGEFLATTFGGVPPLPLNVEVVEKGRMGLLGVMTDW